MILNAIVALCLYKPSALASAVSIRWLQSSNLQTEIFD